ncbi:hypothetical protein [Halorussus ruber]|uniref:hypothetical protein n=1 Tax=Halorussus ruber TaxID=1126238 RepID=UPI00143D39C3|nr:hypothetical protein [Halorussus ruber]
MASSDANADVSDEAEGVADDDSEEEREFLGAGPEEGLKKNSSADEAFSSE